MNLQTHIANKIDATAMEANLDLQAKLLLSEKIILAHILVHTVKEFFGMEPELVVPLIEDAVVGTIPVDANEYGEIIGLNTEQSSPREGVVRYDLYFVVWTPEQSERMKFYINIELQNDPTPGYEIPTRGIYYSARMISAQKNTEFFHNDYDNIKKVYSIWLCMNVPQQLAYSLTEFSLTKNELGPGLSGDYWKHYDIPHVMIVGIPKVVTADAPRLHRLIGTYLSPELSPNIKKQVLQQEYNIPMTEHIERSLMKMCDLSQYVKNEGRSEGRDEGRANGIVEGEVKTYLKFGWTVEAIAKELQLSLEQVQDIIQRLQ